jgi:membrane-bound inhibitor of C-type lysozyme
MKIIWNKVTKFSQVVAIIVFVGVFLFGLYLGRWAENKTILGYPINSAKFVCAEGKVINTDFYMSFIYINFTDGKKMYLPQTISASGARYANSDESVVFWNKGDTAFITEGDQNIATYKDCMISK